MKQIWAPWRLAFIQKAPHAAGCIFCAQPAMQQDRRAYILWRGRHAYVMMNIYPYNNGHLLIAPYRHIATMEDLPPAVLLDMMRLVQRAIKAVRRAYAPEGFNLGINQGRAAGAGIEHHIHLHIVPRWEADTNFMPLLGETRVLPHHLKASFVRLKAAFSANAARPRRGVRRRPPAPRTSRQAP
jgi:ATP adenylyltransferase